MADELCGRRKGGCALPALAAIDFRQTPATLRRVQPFPASLFVAETDRCVTYHRRIVLVAGCSTFQEMIRNVRVDLYS